MQMEMFDIISDYNIKAAEDGCVVAIGLFDSLHPGHRAVIKRAVSKARDLSLKAVVLTFDIWSAGERHSPKQADGRLLTPSIFSTELSKLGVDMPIILPFSKVREFSAERFVREVLVSTLKARAVYCGENFRFGAGAHAGMGELTAFGKDFGFAVRVLPLVRHGDEPISSTRIRACLERGDIVYANEMLGRQYAFDFELVPDRGFNPPLITQLFPKEYCTPRHALYKSAVDISGKTYFAATKIEASHESGSAAIARTHPHGFDGELRGKKACIRLYDTICKGAGYE